MPKKRPAAGARAVERERVAAQALEMRLKGHTFREIGAALGVDPQLCGLLVREEMAAAAKRRHDDAEDLCLLQELRLDRMLKALDLQIEKGNSRSIEVGLKILERQAKLRGLDAPEKSMVMLAYAKMSDEDLLEEAKRASLDLGKVLPAGYLLPGEAAVPDALLPAPAPLPEEAPPAP